MRIGLFSATLAFSLISAQAFAQLEEVSLQKQISGHAAGVNEIDTVEVIEEVADQDNVMNSYLIVEMGGVFESHGESDDIAVQLIRTDDGIPAFAEQRYEAKLFSVQPEAEALRVGSGFITALSHPKRFKVRFKIAPNMWDSRNNLATWNIVFRYQKYQPVAHTVTRGITANLRKYDGTVKWTTHKLGFHP